MLSQTIHYWQEIFFLTLTSDSEAILWWYHWIVCGINRTIERMANLNVTWFCFCFDFLCSYARWGCFSLVFKFTFSSSTNETGWFEALKMWGILNERYFKIFLKNCTHKSKVGNSNYVGGRNLRIIYKSGGANKWMRMEITKIRMQCSCWKLGRRCFKNRA